MPHSADGTPLGVRITGEYLGTREGKPYTDRNGTPHTPVYVDLLVGRFVEGIEFNDKDTLPQIVALAEARDIITLDVSPVGPWDGTRWGRVSYRGRTV